MRVLRSLSVPQRVVIVVGLGIALLIGWVWWYIGELQNPGGWFTYGSPPAESWTDEYFVVRHRQPVHLAVALGLVIGWSAVSICLLGLRSPKDGADPESR
jgi:hypothetical protein